MWRNGVLATAGDAADLAFAGFAHFTAMQVRDGCVRGLDLHLQRLAEASMTLFGQDLASERIRAWLRTAVQAGSGDASVVVTVRPAAGEFTAAGDNRALEVVVRTDAPASGPTGPLALAVVQHERFLPEVKHVGEGAKTYFLRQAAAQGFDDVAFLDRAGRLSEASIWNLAFFDGEQVIWPQAPKLAGTMMGVLQRQLAAAGVPQQERPVAPVDVEELSAVVMNSWTPGVAVTRIGEHSVRNSDALVRVLHKAHAAEEPAQL
ncbi:aminotransferase class IV family protein [Modestobacter sp. VKM Ac-2983]|nr:aminotransferase class IV family protein [Modestobacter sp. VKM Ac-2983]MCZ2805740.1 aminotransferase class IV family protein [Modestobacter sp. VKM Ac-2983]